MVRDKRKVLGKAVMDGQTRPTIPLKNRAYSNCSYTANN
jgi:hypothetical protein